MNEYKRYRRTTCDECGKQSSWLLVQPNQTTPHQKVPDQWAFFSPKRLHLCPKCIPKHIHKKPHRWTWPLYVDVMLRRDACNMTYKEIGQHYGVSGGRIAQIYRRAHRWLRANKQHHPEELDEISMQISTRNLSFTLEDLERARP